MEAAGPVEEEEKEGEEEEEQPVSSAQDGPAADAESETAAGCVLPFSLFQDSPVIVPSSLQSFSAFPFSIRGRINSELQLLSVSMERIKGFWLSR